LFRRGPETDTEKSGIGRYGDKTERAILARTERCENIFFSFSKRDGILSSLRRSLIDPLMQLMNLNGSTDIYHATEELSGMFLPLVRGRKIVTFHHVSAPGEDMSGPIGYLIWKVAAAVTVRSADIILAASPQTRDELVKTYKLDSKVIEVLTAEIGKQFRTLENTERTSTVGCVSSLMPRKNVAALIRSFSEALKMPGMSDTKLIICGKGPERDGLMRLTRELGIEDNTEFVSGLTDDEIVRFYNTVSAFVLPSSHEGLGLTVIEAQRCCAPVLYFKDARIPEEVIRYAVPCDGEAEMAEQIRRLLSDETYRNRIADTAFEYANGFGEDFEERIIDIYERLIR